MLVLGLKKCLQPFDNMYLTFLSCLAVVKELLKGLLDSNPRV